MCGILGFYHKKHSDESLLRKMAETISYRGPDDEGYILMSGNDYQIGMGFKRLSILDLSANGHQPMSFENLVITFNGEIYNFQEIRKDLETRGYIFTSASDTEVILKSYHCWGLEVLDRFVGMYAIAIYNKNNGELLLIRDRIGIKPLYYYFHNNAFVYASELKPIMSYPYFSPEINRHRIYDYLYHGYITAPDTIFQNVYKLEPGSYLRYNGISTEIVKYWNLQTLITNNAEKNRFEEGQALEKLKELLTSSVKYRMISDVPIGSFLSGGIDSTLITAIMQDLSNQPVSTFTIGFEEDHYNEAPYARKISEYIGTNHFEQYLSINKTRELIEKIPEYYDEPFGDSSALPTILVSRLAKNNATVILSGDGGDEVFCGYLNYDFVREMAKYMIPGKFLGIIQNHFDLGKHLAGIRQKYARYPFLNKHINIVNINYIISKYIIGDMLLDQEFSLNSRYFSLEGLSDNVQELYMFTDMLTYLPDDILTKVDRASMSVSLETRVPILDHRIIEFSLQLPHDLKYRNGDKKYLLKKLAYQYVPKELLERPKHGFMIPVFKWLKNELRPLVNDLLSDSNIQQQGIFSYPRISALIKTFENSGDRFLNGHILWNLFVFQLWHSKYLK
jgi:asparagine synthase (glutamine-hydrolysing)